MAFPVIAPLVFSTAFTGIKAAIVTLFSYAVVRIVVVASVFALTSLAGYFLADALLPAWLSVETLQSAIESFSPAVSYFLYLGGFYTGFPKIMAALCLAWIVKKLPAFVWFGPLMRGVK